MKRAELKAIYNFLGTIQVNKVKDRQVRLNLMDIFISMRSALKEIDETTVMIRDKFISGKETDVMNHDTLIRQIKETADPIERMRLENQVNPDVNQLVIDTNDAINEYLRGDLDIELSKIRREDLMDIIVEQDIDITISALMALEPIIS